MSEKQKFPRSQKFRLSEKGQEAVRAYEVTIAQAKTGHGRAEFEAARAAWGTPRGLTADDAPFLVEFGAGRTLKETAAALADCGTTPKQVKEATERLLSVGMLEPVPHELH
ncbi:MAG: hypothetical protein ACOZQL_40700 [Myxococcota bacterium]